MERLHVLKQLVILFFFDVLTYHLAYDRCYNIITNTIQLFGW